MTDIKLTLVVACALIDTDNRVLIAQRPEGKELAGLWEFPGGKVEPGNGRDGGLRCGSTRKYIETRGRPVVTFTTGRQWTCRAQLVMWATTSAWLNMA
jgi:adenine-specific DNA glycosylase